LKINDLRNDPVGFAQLPKLDVAGSSPVARSLEVVGFSEVEWRWRAGGPRRFFVRGHFGVTRRFAAHRELRDGSIWSHQAIWSWRDVTPR